MSAAKTLSQNTLEKIQQRFALQEIQNADGKSYMTLTSLKNSTPVGMVRLFADNPIQKLVYVGLTLSSIGLDSHMLFAFTQADSPVPHFTLDSIQTGSHFAFHLDLIPRVDLGANLQYINATLQSLTAEFEAAKTIEGLTPAHLSPRQYALMSPWMLAYRASEVAFMQINKPVNVYLEHWFELVERRISAEATSGIDPASLAQRDQLNRQALFNPEVDPVWGKVDSLIGPEASARIREILKNQVVEGL
ncbi:MAG: hypothetical protein AB4426_18265 [Xenococcaceae cyanobacterium]